MLLSFDVLPETVAEHDDWHTHEHLPERLAIPGFLRGTRWVAIHGGPRYLVLYEVEELATLTSPAYLARLEQPTAWTSKLMPHYRGMSRGFCTVSGSFGLGSGHVAVLLRFAPDPASAASLRRRLLQDVLPQLPDQPGIGSVHLLEGATAPPMTNEQRIRGRDAGVAWALLATAYREAALPLVARDICNDVEHACAARPVDALYRLDYSLAQSELGVQS